MSGLVVVTGASGFIGRSVVNELAGRRVPHLAVRRSGIGNTQRLASYRDSPAGKVLIHLAEESRVDAIDAKSAQEQEEVLAALIAKGFSRIVYASSAAVYGDASRDPRRPGDATIAANAYLAGKLACERRVLTAGGVVVRLANVYGPMMHATTVMAEILRQVPIRGPVLVRDLAPVRDFLWIEDAARGVVDIALGAGRGVFNLGNGIGASIADLARLVVNTAGQEGRELKATAASGRASTLVLDIALTQETFGWRPETTLADGIRRMIAAR